MTDGSPRTFLLTWNPSYGAFRDCAELAERTQQDEEYVRVHWSTGRRRNMAPGDRVFLLMQGQGERSGIIASGWVAGDVYDAPYWGDPTRHVPYVPVDFDMILDPDTQESLRVSALQQLQGPRFNWTPQTGGIHIPEAVASQVESAWKQHLAAWDLEYKPKPPDTEGDAALGLVADEVLGTEGDIRQRMILHRRREQKLRDAKVAQALSEAAKLRCEVCGFSFAERYGDIGEEFIEVHHLTPLAELDEETRISVNDLAVVCANCHRMLHRGEPVLTLDDLRDRLI